MRLSARARRATWLFILGLALGTASPVAAEAAPAPAWTISSLPVPTSFAPAEPSGPNVYEVAVVNSGTAPTSGEAIVIADVLPAGVEFVDAELKLRSSGSLVDFGADLCMVEDLFAEEKVTCTVPADPPPSADPDTALLYPGEGIRLLIRVSTVGSADGEDLVNFAEVEGGGAAAAAVTGQNRISILSAPSGFAELRAAATGADGLPFNRAGAAPYQYTVGFALNTKPVDAEKGFFAPVADPKDVRIDLPAGLVADSTAVPRCPVSRFLGNECLNESAVGFLLLRQLDGLGTLTPEPLYNLEPPPGMSAQLGFRVLTVPFYVNTELRTGDDYGLTAVLKNLIQTKRITAATLFIWGDPSDPSHDPLRGHCLSEGGPERFSLGSCPWNGESHRFLRLPTSCLSPLTTAASFDTWKRPGEFISSSVSGEVPSLCSSLSLGASLEARPSTSVADSPTGLRLALHLPQAGGGQADLRDLTVTLPRGLAISPAGAQGLAACSPDEAGLKSAPGAPRTIFDPSPLRCPDAAKVGALTAHTPILDARLRGSVYVAAAAENPFGALFALYLEAADPAAGVRLKLAGRVEADPLSGRLTVRFEDGPQLPLEDLELTLFQGPRSPLRSPLACGAYASSANLLPWSAPESGGAAAAGDEFEISVAPGGKPCPQIDQAADFDPQLTAGTEAAAAGKSSPLQLELRRDDGSQRISSFDLTLPSGVLAKLTGVGSCGGAELTRAANRSGRDEVAEPACPPGSRIGAVELAAGSGPSPLPLAGTVFLADPYQGAPLSLAAVVPAVAGPFDLGTVVVRMPVFVDPATARLRVTSEALPVMRRGVPLELRSLRISLDREGFVVNPTSCDPSWVEGLIGSLTGAVAPVANRFQVGGCSDLRFRPRLGLRFVGATHRGSHPTVRIVLRQAAGEANLRRTAVLLPRTQMLDSDNFGGVCSRQRYAAGECPKGARQGYAKAWSPLLDQPLEGPVYLRSSSHGLPDAVASLDGRFRLDLAARLDAVNGRLRATFRGIPDVPLSKVVVRINGGKWGLLVNTGRVCARAWRGNAVLVGQNGALQTRHPLAKTDCRTPRH